MFPERCGCWTCMMSAEYHPVSSSPYSRRLSFGADPGKTSTRESDGRPPLLRSRQKALLCQLTIGNAKSVLENRLDADLRKPRVDLRTTAVHQHAADTHARQEHQIRNDASLRHVQRRGYNQRRGESCKLSSAAMKMEQNGVSLTCSREHEG